MVPLVIKKRQTGNTKTGLLDRLIRQDLQAAYDEGGKDAIVAQVVATFPELEAKSVSALFFSRRAVARKMYEKQYAEEQVKQEATA